MARQDRRNRGGENCTGDGGPALSTIADGSGGAAGCIDDVPRLYASDGAEPYTSVCATTRVEFGYAAHQG